MTPSRSHSTARRFARLVSATMPPARRMVAFGEGARLWSILEGPRRRQGMPWPLLLAADWRSTQCFLALPGSLLEKLQALAAGVCAQRPSHSYFFDSAQLPLEARMGGIFAGFL